MRSGAELIVGHLARGERPADLEGALGHGLRAGGPFVLDVHVDRDIRPLSVGKWQLPPAPYVEPALGKRRLPGD